MATFLNQFALRCPQCKSTGDIDVVAMISIRLVKDGSDADASRDGSHNWDSNSAANCGCGFRGQVSDFHTHQCQNCLKIVSFGDLKAVKDYHERVAEGENEPSGECPDCGALCQRLEDSEELMQDTPGEEESDDHDDGGVETVAREEDL